MFGAFSSFLDVAAQKAKELSDAGLQLVNEAGFSTELEHGYNVEEEDAPSKTDPGSSVSGATNPAATHDVGDSGTAAAAPNAASAQGKVATLAYWVNPPHLPRTEWNILVSGIVSEENTYCVPFPTFLGDDDSLHQLSSASGLSADTLRNLWDAVAADELTAPLLTEALSVLAGIDEIRFRVVPKYCVEDDFWKNLFVRLRVYQNCASISAALDTMDILHREARITAAAVRKRGFGNPCNVAELQKIRDDVGASAMLSKWLETKRCAALSELQSALSSLQLLVNLVAKQEVSELADSVRESCRYRKTKIAGLLGDLQASPSKLVGTDLEVDSGEVYLDLLRLNEQLHDGIAEYETLKANEKCGSAKRDDGDASPGCERHQHGAVLANSSPALTVGVHSGDKSATSPLGSPPPPLRETPREISNAFTADLPWDDDDE